MGRLDVTHEAVARAKAAQRPPRDQLAPKGQGEEDVQVALGVAVVVVIVGDRQLLGRP